MSCGCFEVDESMPSVDTVFNRVSAIKGHIYVKNVVMVGHIFCSMLLFHKHKRTLLDSHNAKIGIKFYGMYKAKQVPQRIRLHL